MRLRSSVGRPELVAPVTQRNIGVWLALTLIAVIVGLDMVGGGNAELLGLLVSPPILAASFVGPKRTVAVGLVALATAIGYGRAVGVDLLAGAQGVPAVAIGAATVLSGVVARVGSSGNGGCARSPGSLRSPSGRCWAGCPRRWEACAWPC
jgi:type IV secretory pathway TrbL component